MSLIKEIVVGTLIGGLAYVFFQKKIDYWKTTIKQIKAVPTALRNFNITGGKIKFTIDVKLFNPTNNDFKPDGIVAVLQKINVKDKLGNKIATVVVDKTYLSIPAKSSCVLKNLLVEIPIMGNVLNWKNLIKIKTQNDIVIECIVTVLGKEFLITN